MMLRITKKGDVLVAKTDPPLIGNVAHLVSRLKGAKLVHWVQDVFPEIAIALGVPGMRRLEKPLTLLRNRSLNDARAIVVIGKKMKEHLTREIRSGDQFCVIPNWYIGPRALEASEDIMELKRNWVGERKFVIGYSGNFGRAHDFGGIKQAAVDLRDITDIVFLFVGGGPQYEDIRKWSISQGLTNIHFEPYQALKILPISLRVADIHLVTLEPEAEGLIVPSKFYGIIEANRPVVYLGSESGELSELISYYDCGFTLPPGAGLELSQRIQELKEDPSLLKKYKKGAVSAAAALSRNSAVDNWKVLLQRVIAND